MLANECIDLSERQRTVVVLRHALDYSIERIAALEGATASTVKDRLLRARTAMRRMFRREDLLTTELARTR